MTTLPYDSPASPETLTRAVPLPVQLVAAAPAKQRRWTVLIRWIMLVPHYVVLYFLNLAVSVVAFIGWWGALFTGRLPEFAHSYLSGVTRWSTRVQAYGLLLTDQYPPFSLDDQPGYPVRIAIPQPGKLNRAAVLFRVILAIPAGLLTGLVTYGGTTIVAVIAWLITLITGKLPTPLHLAYTAILRYSARCNCYVNMLTAAYPAGLFGDGSAESDALAVFDDTAGPAAVELDGVPVSPVVDLDATTPLQQIPVNLAASGEWTLGFPGASDPASWRLLLTRGARQLLGWFIGVGAAICVAYIVTVSLIVAHQVNMVSVSNAIDTVNTANDSLNSAMSTYETTVDACTDVSCAETADGTLGAAFAAMASTVHGTPMPGSAVSAANTVYADATKVAQGLTQLSHLGPTTTPDQYESTAKSLGVDQDITQFQTDFNALGDALNSAS